MRCSQNIRYTRDNKYNVYAKQASSNNVNINNELNINTSISNNSTLSYDIASKATLQTPHTKIKVPSSNTS